MPSSRGKSKSASQTLSICNNKVGEDNAAIAPRPFRIPITFHWRSLGLIAYPIATTVPAATVAAPVVAATWPSTTVAAEGRWKSP